MQSIDQLMRQKTTFAGNRGSKEVEPPDTQTVTDFQNETAKATREIADNFLDSQKEVINSMQSAWTPFADRTSSSTGTISSGNNNYWKMGI
jgi:hypothetical protein